MSPSMDRWPSSGKFQLQRSFLQVSKECEGTILNAPEVWCNNLSRNKSKTISGKMIFYSQNFLISNITYWFQVSQGVATNSFTRLWSHSSVVDDAIVEKRVNVAAIHCNHTLSQFGGGSVEKMSNRSSGKQRLSTQLPSNMRQPVGHVGFGELFTDRHDDLPTKTAMSSTIRSTREPAPKDFILQIL